MQTDRMKQPYDAQPVLICSQWKQKGLHHYSSMCIHQGQHHRLSAAYRTRSITANSNLKNANNTDLVRNKANEQLFL